MEAVEARVLKRILPRQDEEARLHTIVHELTAKLSERIAARGLDAKPILVGSVAKGVHLHETEVDLFVAFPPDTPREKLESEG
ncbi:MAG TPA: nucleotidyltransferase domain-containing protein, partial [Thermoplasmata archaeon]|nr:nucleotidyltransferase domain-containing protein [Thermoplasmata archaeon]